MGVKHENDPGKTPAKRFLSKKAVNFNSYLQKNKRTSNSAF